MAKQNGGSKGSAGIESVSMGDEGTWESASVGQATGARWYSPDSKEPGHLAVGLLGPREQSETKFGPKGFYKLTTFVPGCDDKGDWAEGEVLIVWESAGLVGLSALVGRVVRITPTGKKGRAYTYRVDHRAV